MDFGSRGKDPTEFGKKYPAYSGDWPIQSFGNDWFDSYLSRGPEKREDLDLHGISNEVMSPLYVVFFKSRFAGVAAGPVNFEPFRGGSRTGKPEKTIRVVPVAGGREGVWKADLRIADLSSPPDRPMELEIDPETHQLRKIHLVLDSKYGTAEGDLHLVGCRN